MFIPIHCPNSQCTHYTPPDRPDWYRYFGTYTSKTFGIIPRYRCKACQKTFSSMSFSIDYFAKKHLSMEQIYNQLNGGLGIRKIARNLHVHHNTIRNRISRMARSAILIHQQVLATLPFKEDFVADGFESFCVSQYFPDNYHLLAGKDSQFIYTADYVTLRRKGRMRDDQKDRRGQLEMLWRPPKGNLQKSFGEMCGWLERRTEDREKVLILYTDEKKEYGRALKENLACHTNLERGRWIHHVTSSKAVRSLSNPLFAVNYIDREIRKDMAAHVRESVQFNRNVNDAMSRMSLYLFDHNYRKPFRIRDKEKMRLTHVEVAGADRGMVELLVSGFFERRYFADGGMVMEGPSRKTLVRGWETPLCGQGRPAPGHLAA